MRRWLAPAALAVLTAAATALALDTPPTPHQAKAGLAPLKAPLLSLRRVPELLTQTIADQRLAQQLDQVFKDPAAANSCLLVEQTDRRLYTRNPDRPLIPASNLKVLTALAALAKLGPDERFSTAAKAARPIQPDGTLAGPLYLVGGGDPLLETADYAASFKNQPQIHTPFEQLADDLVAKGLKHIAGPGGVQGDESRYDTQRYIPTWKPRYITDAEVGPQSALMVNDGFTQFKPRHTAAAAPAAHAAAVLSDLLKGRGVSIDGPAGQNPAPAGAATISELRSPPLREVVAEMLKESDNTTAELLTKELGRRAGGQGSTTAGLKAVRSLLDAAHLPTAPLQAVDGSGLDRSDRATCGLILAALDTGDAQGPLQSGLPTAAKDGTLAQRFQGHPAAGRLRAKTGSLDGVAGLSGFVDGPGAPLVFSLLVNDLARDAQGRALQESVAAVLARYPDAPAPDSLAP
ncbi:MAG TPA: D-alanyl-D-alanine carboxypeptidase/D-alanyl-D-alanine-endopeptidase [Acidimicrobiales bacterium]|nr:D-alanyl-D-alanine carboxypeptidase/D-alanyl-D-alanine-endopeptidase [Acidimicrobiales bacterium]